MAAIPSSMPRTIPRAASSKILSRPIISFGSALILTAIWIAVGMRIVPDVQEHYFAGTYTVAKMASAGQYARLDDAAVFQRYLKRVDPQAVAAPSLRPQFYAFLLSPLARLPQRTAFQVWVAIQVVLLCACWAWAVLRFGLDALIWGALSLPCCLGILYGQNCVLLLAIAVGGYALAKKKSYWAAGAVLALALMKFHLILFLAPAMLLGRRWKMLGGFVGMGAALIGWCYLLGGQQSLETYAALLRNNGLENPATQPMIGIQMIGVQGMLANLHADFGVLRIVLALGALVAAGFVLRERQPLWRWMSLTITASLLAAPHVYAFDAAIMVLPIWLVQAYSRKIATRAVFAALATPLPFLAGLAGQPWAIVTPVCLAACFGTLTWEAWISRRNRDQADTQESRASELILAEPVL